MKSQPHIYTPQEVTDLEEQIVDNTVIHALHLSRYLAGGEAFTADIVGIEKHPEFYAPSVQANLVGRIGNQDELRKRLVVDRVRTAVIDFIVQTT